jgi:hypothetical protein
MEVDETGAAAPPLRPIDMHSKLNEGVARDILGLPVAGDVSKDDVSRHFKEMARLWHPDKRADKEAATEAFKRINMAKRYLLSILSGDVPSQGEGADDDDGEGSQGEEEEDWMEGMGGAAAAAAQKEGVIRLVERISLSKLERIMRNLPTVLAQVSRDKAANMKSMLLALEKEVLDDGRLVVEYSRSEHGIGRRWACSMKGKKTGMQGMVRLLRHELADNKQLDADMVNCHATLLHEFCVQHGCQDKVRTLEKLVKDREGVLGRLMDKMKIGDWDEMKGRVSTAMFTYPGKCHRHLKALNAEMTVIYELAKEHHPEIVTAGEAAARKKRPDHPNLQGSVVSLLAQHLEARVMDAVVAHCKTLGIIQPVEVTLRDGAKVMCEGEYTDTFDGLQLLIEMVKACYPDGNFDPLLQGMAAAVLETTGFRVQFKFKPMDLRIEGLPEISENQYIVISALGGDAEAAERFFEMVKDDVRMVESTVFVRENGIWIHDQKWAVRLLRKRCLKSKMVKLSDRGEMKSYSSEKKHADHIVEAMLGLVPQSPNFVEEVWQASKGKLFFLDGYYDFGQGRFIEGFDGVQSFACVPRTFPRERNEQLIKELHEKVIDATMAVRAVQVDDSGNQVFVVDEHGEHVMEYEMRNDLMATLARGAVGCTEDKTFVFIIGPRNCGKGVLAECFTAALGPGYITSYPPTNLLRHKGMMGGIDQAKLGSWMIPMQHRRLAISSELDVPPGGIINGTVCKTLASGGDNQLVRSNRTDERLIRIQARPVLCVNSTPIVKPANALEEVLVFEMPYKFVDSPDETNPLEKQRAEIKGWVAQPEVADAFVHCIIDYYRPQRVRPGAYMKPLIDALKGGQTDEELIESHFEFTGRNGDFLTSAFVEEVLGKEADVTTLDVLRAATATATRMGKKLKDANRVYVGKGRHRMQKRGIRGVVYRGEKTLTKDEQRALEDGPYWVTCHGKHVGYQRGDDGGDEDDY